SLAIATTDVDEFSPRAALLRRWLAGQRAPMPAHELLAAELASLVAEDGSLAIATTDVDEFSPRAALLRRWLAGQRAPMPA
ncbi:hypothetical protein G7L34_26515, partial [Klebsiella quasipneumoniae]|nr:hypothetical protein [Klebsiella quasipneumoniae]